jgi:phage repressor protein C with HTH and peptisase S24 domain
MDKAEYSPELFLRQIERIAEIHGLKFPSEFEKKIGMRGAVSSWEPLDKGGNPKKKFSIPSVDTLLKIKNLFNVSVDWLLTGEEPKIKEILQPVISSALGSFRGTPPGLSSENFIAIPQVEGRLAAKHASAIPTSEIKTLFCLFLPGASPLYYKNLIAIQVASNYHAMEPTIRAGDVVIIDTSSVTPAFRGIYAIRSQDGEECDINRVYLSEKWLVISSDNLDYAPRILALDQAKPIIIGRVLWSWTGWAK